MLIRPLALALLLIAVACSSSEGTTPTSESPTGDPRTDKLAQVRARGTLVMPTDPAYPPASFGVEGAERARDTLWGDRWDLAFTSIGITHDRMDVLYFTRPYYATPERFYVEEDSPYTELDDLDGARIGVCAGCFADLYLQKNLNIPGVEVTYHVDSADIVAYDVERSGLDDVGAGELDAFLCQETVGDQAISEGIALKALDPPAYEAFIGGTIDRSSGLMVGSFYRRINEILQEAHADGTLAALSVEFFATDYATAAASYDIDGIAQEVE